MDSVTIGLLIVVLAMSVAVQGGSLAIVLAAVMNLYGLRLIGSMRPYAGHAWT